MGDGNLNLVFIVEGPAGSLVTKQALPYVRLVGESWPLPLSRSLFEHAALAEQARHVPRLAPRVFHFDPDMALIVMERLHPHVILRKGLCAGTIYPRLAEDAAEFLARTLFHTSDLYLPAAEKKRRAAFSTPTRRFAKSPRTWFSPTPTASPKATAGPLPNWITSRRNCGRTPR